MEAFGGLRQKDAVLWVVGKGEPASYARQARRLGAAASVKFWGPQADLAPFYQAATVLALPTIYDPCSNVVLEALGSGLPVITTAANGAAEFLRPDGHGKVLARADDVPGLILALEEYLSRGEAPEVRRGCSRRGGSP